MRSPNILCVTIALAVTVLPSFSALARNATYRYIQARYEGCYCYFGYLGGDNKPECVPATACSSEGGTCRGFCRANRDQE
jgi:hypothetical protein